MFKVETDLEHAFKYKFYLMHPIVDNNHLSQCQQRTNSYKSSFLTLPMKFSNAFLRSVFLKKNRNNNFAKEAFIMTSTYSLNESSFTHIHVFGVGFA